MGKKSIIKQIASKIRNEHSKTLKKVTVITSEIDDDDVNTFIKNSVGNTENMILIGKNEHTEWFFDSTGKANNKIIAIIYKGGFTYVNKDVNVKYILKSNDDINCQICLEKFRYESRSCNNCGESFCIKCQIKLVLDGIKNRTYTMRCPFCRYEETLNRENKNVKHYNYIVSIMYRLKREYETDRLEKEDVVDLVNYLKLKEDDSESKYDSDSSDEDEMMYVSLEEDFKYDEFLEFILTDDE